MPYKLNRPRRGVAYRRNPWVYRAAPHVKVPPIAAKAYGRLSRSRSGRAKLKRKGVAFVSKKTMIRSAKRHLHRAKAPVGSGSHHLYRRAARLGIAASIARSGGYFKSKGATKARKSFFKSRKRTRKGRKSSVSKSKKRSAAARKAARTRARNKARRSAAAKRSYRRRKGGRKAARRGGRRHGRRHARRHGRRHGRRAVKRTKIRGTLVRLRGRGRRKGRLVFVVPKSKRAAFRRLKGKRWARQRIAFNPMQGGYRGFVSTLKDVFSLDTLKVVGGGLVGLSVGYGFAELAGRAALGNKSAVDNKLLNAGAGLGGGVLASVGVSYLVGRVASPRVSQAVFWASLIGTAARTVAIFFPGKGFDMPRSAADADKLAMALHANEAQVALKAAAAGLPASAAGPLQGALAALGGARDWLGAPAQLGGGAHDWLPAAGARDYFDASGQGGGHPLVGAGQSW